VDDDDRELLRGELTGTGGSDNAGTDNHNVGGGFHRRRPFRKGSLASRSRTPSEVRNAEPLRLGSSLPSSTRIRPSKTLPTMLSCRHTCPGRSLPSAYRQASLALVPVPQGERS